MIYFDQQRFNATIQNPERFARLANRKIVPKFMELSRAIGFSDEFNDTCLDILLNDTKNKLESLILGPSISELKGAGITDPTIILQLSKRAKKWQLNLLDDLNYKKNEVLWETTLPRRECLDVENQQIIVSESWLESLRQACTSVPTTPNQKKFAKLVKQFEDTHEQLRDLIPSHIHVVEDSTFTGLFILKNGQIQTTRNEILKLIT